MVDLMTNQTTADKKNHWRISMKDKLVVQIVGLVIKIYVMSIDLCSTNKDFLILCLQVILKLVYFIYFCIWVNNICVVSFIWMV